MQSDISTPSHVFAGSSEYILDSVKNIHWHLAPNLVSMSISPHHYLVCMSIAPCPPMKSPPPLFNLHEHSPLQLSSLPEDSPIPLFSGHEDSPMPLLVLELMLGISTLRLCLGLSGILFFFIVCLLSHLP